MATLLSVVSVVLSAVGVGLGLAAFILAYGRRRRWRGARVCSGPCESTTPTCPPALPGTGWRFISVGHAPQPGERYEVAVAVGLKGVQVFPGLCT
jgi:hypothetical protein